MKIAALMLLAARHPCEPCHADLVRKYAQTPMAQTSGPVENTPPGGFTANGFRYSIKGQTLTFGSESRQLAYYVGSGNAARSYLLSVDQFLYEAPATYYTRTQAWGLSPGYQRYSVPFLTRAIAPACLECHATGVQAIAGTQNGYRSPPFLKGGIDCERCHPPEGNHFLKPGHDVCAQCHLSGEIRVGSTAFVRATDSPGMKVTSHVENLAQSACARNSEGRLWCGTCHDPHSVPIDKVTYYRSKCRTCHEPSVCKRGDNCIACHMPSSAVTDAEHVVYTDHSIPRRPVARNRKPPADAELVAFGGAPASSRDLGLAYAIVALREQNAVYSQRAFDLLSRNQDDPQSIAYLADIYRSRKDDRTAETLYRKLYALDKTESSAPANLGAYAMDHGKNEEAVRLFEEALRISPALVAVRYNLALALIRTGRPAEAIPVLEKALVFDPYFKAARDLLTQVRVSNAVRDTRNRWPGPK